jgi:hypothetical protein
MGREAEPELKIIKERWSQAILTPPLLVQLDQNYVLSQT